MDGKRDPLKKDSKQKLVIDNVIQQITAGNTSQGQYSPFGFISPDGPWAESSNSIPNSTNQLDDCHRNPNYNFDIRFPNKIPESVLRRNKNGAFFNNISSNETASSCLSDVFTRPNFMMKQEMPCVDEPFISDSTFLNKCIPLSSKSIPTSRSNILSQSTLLKDDANVAQAKPSYSDVVSSKGNPNRKNSVDNTDNSIKVSTTRIFDNSKSTVDYSPTVSRQTKFGTNSVSRPKSKQASGAKCTGRLKRQTSTGHEDRSVSNKDQNFNSKSSFQRKGSGNLKKSDCESERRNSTEDPVLRYGLENVSIDDLNLNSASKRESETKRPAANDHKMFESFVDNMYTVMPETDLCDVPLNNEQGRASSQGKVNMSKRALNINNNLCNSKFGSRSPSETSCGMNSVKSCNQDGWNSVNKNKLSKPDRANRVLDSSSYKPSESKCDSMKVSSFSFNFSSLFGHKADIRHKEGSQKRRRKKYGESYPYFELLRTAFTYFCTWANFGLVFLLWLFNLVCDVSTMSYKLLLHLSLEVFNKARTLMLQTSNNVSNYVKNKLFSWLPFLASKGNSQTGLVENIELPATGDEAMKRLLACQGEDPYGILGVTPKCSDEDIKKYYKRQAFLVHPDKNSQPGAEEAFKILGHAFDLIGKPEKRKEYDESTLKKEQISNAMQEFSELLKQLHKKMEEAANTICCTNCNGKHRRQKTDRSCFSARYCSKCKIKHPVKDGDLWAESYIFGVYWYYYSCMDGAVYDITQWAQCQSDRLKNLQANTHIVQYRIVTGGNNNNGNKWNGRKQQNEIPSEAELEDFLNTFYQQAMSGSNKTADKSTKPTNNSSKKKSKKKRN